jgi:hypothetical protein
VFPQANQLDNDQDITGENKNAWDESFEYKFNPCHGGKESFRTYTL